LSPNTSIQYVEFSVFAHATEDVDKVIEATCNVVPSEHTGQIVFVRTQLTGYYGNSIVLLETTVKDQEVLRGIVRKLSEGLTSLDKEVLSREIERFVEKGNLYVRLNKQSAFNKVLELDQSDPIRLRIHFKSGKLGEIVEICRDLGLFA